MNEEMKDFFDYLTIHGEPVYTLAECVAAANQNKKPVDGEDEDISDPVTEVRERFRKAVYLCDGKKLAFLRHAAELSGTKAAWEEDVTHYPFRVFNQNDFVYQVAA